MIGAVFATALAGAATILTALYWIVKADSEAKTCNKPSHRHILGHWK